MLHRVALLFLACFFARTAPAQRQELPRVGVLDLTSENVPAAELRLLSDRLRIELFNTGQFLVIERQRMEEILREQGFQQSGCVATECVVEVGQLLGTQKMVAGSVGRVGEVYTISLRSINVETGAIERTAVKDCRCSLEEVLTRSIAEVAAELAGTAAVVTTPLPRGEGVGMVFIESTPPGAQIILNGRPRREVTPATLRQLPAGEHIVRLVKENLIAEERVTVVRDDLVKVSLTLRPGSGSLFIESAVPGAEVSVDGRPQGNTPVLVREIASGTHRVRVTITDYLPWEEQVVVEFDKRAEVSVTLQPCGYLDIRIEPASALVRVNDYRLETGNRRLALATGEYRIAATLADHDSLVQTVRIAQGQVATVRGTLRFLFGRVQVNSTPSGATVSSTPPGISGTTPLWKDRVEPGRYRVQVTMARRAPYEETVEVRRDETATVSANLPWHPEVIRARNARIRAGFRWTSLGIALVSAGVAYKFDRDAKSAYDERNAAYEKYRQAYTSAEVNYWRQVLDDAEKRGDRAASKRNILYGVAGAGFSIGVVLWVW